MYIATLYRCSYISNKQTQETLTCRMTELQGEFDYGFSFTMHYSFSLGSAIISSSYKHSYSYILQHDIQKSNK